MPRPAPRRVVSLCTDPRVDRRILDGARLLSQHGWHTTVIAQAIDDDRDEQSYPEVPIFRLTGHFVPGGMLPDRDVPAEVTLAERLFPQQRRLVAAALAHPADVVIANDLPQLAAGVMAARAHGATLIYDAHEFFPRQRFVAHMAATLEPLERLLLRHCDGVVTVNDSIADLMAMEYGCPRPEVILNCPSLRHRTGAPTDDGRLRRALGIGAAQRILLFQGVMGPHRNLPELVDAMAQVRTPDVVLALMGPRALLGDELEARAAAAGLLGRRVFLVPEVSAAELLEWTVGADAGIIPYPHCDMNTLMCTPNKLFEFLAAGLPILASHGTELRRFVGDQGVGLNADMRTPADFARAIDDLFAGPLGEWRTRAAEVAPRYTWEVEGAQWPGIVERAVATRARRVAAGDARTPEHRQVAA